MKNIRLVVHSGNNRTDCFAQTLVMDYLIRNMWHKNYEFSKNEPISNTDHDKNVENIPSGPGHQKIVKNLRLAMTNIVKTHASQPHMQGIVGPICVPNPPEDSQCNSGLRTY